MRTIFMKRLLLIGTTIFAAVALTVACSDDDSLQSGQEPGLTVDGVSGGQFLLSMPPDESRPQKQQSIVQLKNTGEAPLKITKLELVDLPPRLLPIGETTGTCMSDEDCGSNEVCLTQAGSCVSTTLPETPVEISPGLRHDIEFLVAKGECELQCPPPPEDVPEEIAPRYCGKLEIATNAINSNSLVDEGRATLYFIDPGVRGRIDAQPTSLEFTSVSPGATVSQEFSIQNTCNEPLRVNGISIADKSNFFASVQDLPAEIASAQSQTFTLTMQPPAEASADELDFQTVIEFDSTAINTEEKLAVFSTKGAGAAPVISVDPNVLKFDQSTTQTLSVENLGEATLLLNDFRFEPSDADVFYTVKIDGAEFSNSVPIPKNSDPLEVTVEFDRPSGNTDSSVATMIIGHNDKSAGFETAVTLLGDEGDQPIGQIYPTSFTFLAANGNNETREFIIRNVGTADLVIDTIDTTNFNPGSDAEFEIVGGTTTVAPGAIHKASVEFTGADAEQDNGTALFESNNGTGDLTLGIAALPTQQEIPMAVATPDSTNDPRVGDIVGYSATDSTPAGAGSAAIWTLLSRPSGSEVFVHTTGEEMSFVPDVAGTYEFSLMVFNSGAEAQETFTVEVVD